MKNLKNGNLLNEEVITCSSRVYREGCSAVVTYVERGAWKSFGKYHRVTRRVTLNPETLSYWSSQGGAPCRVKGWNDMKPLERIKFNVGYINPNYSLEFLS